jgi:hypothetical protein
VTEAVKTIDELAEQPRPFECTAWAAIGWDDGPFRIKGGRTKYEAVMYNCANNGRLVKLARLDTKHGIREVSRYVEPDTILEFL